MARKPNYRIVRNVSVDDPLIIRDLGPWNYYMTVTNGAEEVVAELGARGLLPEGRRLFYYDSEGEFDELVVEGGKFAGFRRLTAEERAMYSCGVLE